MLNLVELVLSMGTPPAGAQDGSQSIMPTIIMFAIIFGIFYFFMVRPQMKQQKKHQEMIGALKKGDKVLTAGGIYGIVVGISDPENKVVIRIDDNTKVEIAKGYIVGVKKEGQEIAGETKP